MWRQAQAGGRAAGSAGREGTVVGGEPHAMVEAGGWGGAVAAGGGGAAGERAASRCIGE